MTAEPCVACPPRGGRPRPPLVEILGPDGVVEARHPEDHYLVRQLRECLRRGKAAGWSLRPVTSWGATGQRPGLAAVPA